MSNEAPEEQLASFIAEYTPEIGALAEEALAKMRARLPGAIELVYDNYNALAIGFGPTERTSGVIFSITFKPLDSANHGRIIIKSISAKQRPRRPA